MDQVVDHVVENHPGACPRCGTLLNGEDSDLLRHQVIEIPLITPLVIEHRLHRLICPFCSASTCAPSRAYVLASANAVGEVFHVADGGIPTGEHGWQGVMVIAMVTVLI